MFKKTSLVFGFSLMLVFIVSLLFIPPQAINASINNCGIFSVDETVQFQSTNGDEITIQCGGVRSTWNGILQEAVLTNVTKDIKNYEIRKGPHRALHDFHRMPGTHQPAAEGRLLKHYNGGTLAYYPSTSTGAPTLSFPSSDRVRTDKVRYY